MILDIISDIALDCNVEKMIGSDELMKDEVFSKFMENLIQVMKLEFVTDVYAKEYRAISIASVYVVGTIHLYGTLMDENATANERRILEHRIITEDYIYYLFIVMHGTTSDANKVIDMDHRKVEDISSNIMEVDGLSRCIDYYLDCICHESEEMRLLHLRDEIPSEDPVVVLAKAYALYMSPVFDNIRGDGNSSESDEEKIEWFHRVDATITQNLRTDWLINSSIKSQDKAMSFSPQLQLKQSLYIYLDTIYRELGGDIKKLTEKFRDLFVNGEIYNVEEEIIKRFLVAGTAGFSTAVLNEQWKQFI